MHTPSCVLREMATSVSGAMLIDLWQPVIIRREGRKVNNLGSWEEPPKPKAPKNRPETKTSYRKRNRERIRQQAKAWRDAHRDEINARARAKRAARGLKLEFDPVKQRAKRLARRKLWREKNRDKLRQKDRERLARIRASKLQKPLVEHPEP